MNEETLSFYEDFHQEIREHLLKNNSGEALFDRAYKITELYFENMSAKEEDDHKAFFDWLVAIRNCRHRCAGVTQYILECWDRHFPGIDPKTEAMLVRAMIIITKGVGSSLSDIDNGGLLPG